MKVAVVDIGSNAVRNTFYGIERVRGDEILLKKLSYLRLPIRLGEDVFTTGEISADRMNKILHMAHAFKLLCTIHEVNACRLLATSAMREAKNGQLLIELVKIQKDVEIELIDGEEEAELIFESVFLAPCIDPAESYMSIDVGGGSTEITFLRAGKREKSRSFKLGSVRSLHGQQTKKEWERFATWVSKQAAQFQPRHAIGTGGNINKMHKLCGLSTRIPMTITQFGDKIDELASCSPQQLVEDLRLKPDRADVILPASEIYYTAMRQAGLDSIFVPKVGLAEGAARKMFRRYL